MPQELAAPPSAPVQGADGGIGSESVLQAGASLSAPGGHIDPLTRVDTQQYKQKLNPVLSDSGVPGGPLPDAAAVGEHPTLSAARRPSTPRPWRRLETAPEVGQQTRRQSIPPFNLQNFTRQNQPQAKTPNLALKPRNLTLGGCLDEVKSTNLTLSAQQPETPTILERSESALENRAGLGRHGHLVCPHIKLQEAMVL